MLLTVSIVLGFKREISTKISSLSAEVVIKSESSSTGNEASPVVLSDSLLKKVSVLPFVSRVQKVAFKNGILKTQTENEGIVLKGVEKNFDFSYLSSRLTSGRLPQFTEGNASNEVLISKPLADKLGLTNGGKMLVYFIAQKQEYDSLNQHEITRFEKRSRNFTVCGTFLSDFADFDASLAIIDLRQIQRLNYWNKGECGAYEVKTKGLDNVEEQVEHIQELCGYNVTVQSIKEIYHNIFIWLEKLDMNGVIIVILMVLVATINMITALLILILERTTMVGLLKTLGMPTVRIRNIFLWISLKLTGKGMLYGNLIGIGLCVAQYYLKIATLDPKTYYVNYVAIEFNWWYFLWLNVGTLVVCLLMLLLPTLIISKLTPIKTLRFD